jgi:hypothetical protein
VKQSFAEAVGAVSALNGAIDGSVKPKPKRAKPLRRERMDASRTFFCRNKNCDHKTWSPLDQARHMHAEFVWAMEALVMRAPESPEALLLTGGVVLTELTDDECRAAISEYGRARRAGRTSTLELATETRLRIAEYQRRREAGILVAAEAPVRRVPLPETCSEGHLLTGDNLRMRRNGKRVCLTCEREGKRERMQDPENRERENRSKREYWQDPENRERRRLLDRERRARKRAEREA